MLTPPQPVLVRSSGLISDSMNLTDRLPLLVTGLSGVAGYNAFHALQERYPSQVIGIRPPQTPSLMGNGIVAIDMEDGGGLGALFHRFGFRSVLNCHGNCALKSCELDPRMARRLNVASAVALSTWVDRHACRFVHLSTDLVYSGKGNGGHVETDPPDPVTVYGQTMVEAEQVISRICPDAAILRISLPMGPSFNRHAGAIDWIESRFRAGRPATLYFDEVRSCTYVADLTCVFERFLAGNESGLYHVGGPRALTLYQIAQVVNRVGGYDHELLKGIPRRDAGPMPPRAGNVSMNSAKLRRLLGTDPFQPWPFSLGLVPTDHAWHRQRPDEEQGQAHRIRELLYDYCRMAPPVDR